MNMLPTELRLVLQGFEEQLCPLSEGMVSDAVDKKVREIQESQQVVSIEHEAEVMAFGFAASNSDERSEWGTYFGPSMQGTTKDDQVYQWPSIRKVSAETLAYWQHRSSEAIHPVLKARYADLVWDFSKKITGKGASIHCAHTAIDAYLDTASQKLFDHHVYAVHYVKRALELAISINDRVRIECVRDAIIRLEQDVYDNKDPRTWGFAFDLLCENKNTLLSDQQREDLVRKLEDILTETASSANTMEPGDPFKAEQAAMRLAPYYRRLNKMGDAHRVLRAYASAFIAAAKSASRMQSLSWLRRVFDILCEYGMDAEAENLSVQLREIGPEARQEMQTIPFRLEVPVTEVEKFVEEMLAGSLGEVLDRIAVHFIPDNKEVEEQVKKLAEVAPLISMIRGVIMAPDGRDVAEMGSVEDDLAGRVVHQISQNLQIEDLFLRKTMEGAIDRFKLGSQEVIDYIYQSPVFETGRRNIIRKGLDAYFSNEHVTSVHLLIPQIEHALRKLLSLCRRPTFRRGRNGGLELILLHEILRDSVLNSVLSERVVIYLRFLFTDKRGWNLRNDLCHGILEPDTICSGISDRVLHALLVLGTLRESYSQDRDNAPGLQG